MQADGWVSTHEDVTHQRNAEAALKRAVAESERAEREATAAHTRLREAFEVVPEGLALFDAEDRYVLWNRRYAELYARTPNGIKANAIKMGARFDDVLRAGLAAGLFADARGREQEWLAERLALHAQDSSTHEQRLSDNRWLRICERRTADGGSVGIRIDISELKHREESVRTLFEFNPVPLLVIDCDDLKFLAVNDAAVRHYGYSREQFLAMTKLGLLPQEERERYLELFDAFRKSDRVEFHSAAIRRHRKADGSDILVNVFGRKLNYENRSALLCSIIDVTERVRAQEERDRNRDFLDRIIDNVTVSLQVKDARTLRYVLVNKATERLWGLTRDQVIGKTPHEIFDKETADLIAEQDHRQLQDPTRNFYVPEHKIDTPDKGVRVVTTNRIAIRDQSGEVQYLVSVVEDVTERVCAEEERDRNRDFLDRIIDNVTMTILVKDARTLQYVLANRAAERLWGFSRSEMIGKTPHEIFDRETAELVEANDRKLLESGSNFYIPAHKIDTRNGPRIVTSNRVAVRNQSGEVQYVLGVVEDVTERKHLDDQLRQAQKMEAVGNLTGGIAHDFNNLLTVIIGNLDLLSEDVAGNVEAEQKIDTIAQAAERGADLTRHMLAFSRRQPLQAKEVDINTLIGGTTRLLSRALGGNIGVTLHTGVDLPPVLVDAPQFETALLNIAINARDAMPASGTLTVATRLGRLDAEYAAHNPGVAAGTYVLIEMTDTGVGIPPDVVERIFEPFFTTKPQGQGTGLGLSMVYGFIKQSGGHVKVYSEVGHGTTFQLFLPLAERVAQRATARRPPARRPRAARRAGNHMILAVEDNPDIRATVVRQLRDLGYRVREAEDANAALQILDAAEPVDLLFTDMILPGGINGKELATEARTKCPDLKVLFTSGFPGTAGRQPARLEAGDVLLSKPYHKDDLAKAIEAALSAPS